MVYFAELESPSPLLHVAVYWQSHDTKAWAKKLSQILANNIDNEVRGIGHRNTKNVVNQGGDTGNQGGNVNMTVEITWNSNRNYKLKDWKKVKIINLVSRIFPNVFLLNFGRI